jgi:hypothetical protein
MVVAIAMRSMRSTRLARMAAFLAAVTAACGCTQNPTGVLGKGEFRYLCDGHADVACTGVETSDLPGAIAVGATFQIGYTPKSSTGYVQGDTGYEIVAASPRLASTSGDTIAALREGYVALLARQVGNAAIEDFVHLHFGAIRTLVVTPVTVSAGGQQSIDLQALDALGATLAGRLSCQWEVTQGAPAIGVIAGPPTGGLATVTASAQADVSAGRVHVVCGAASADVPVTVTGVAPADAGSPGDGGAPIDAGSSVDAASHADAGAPVDAADAPEGGPLG